MQLPVTKPGPLLEGKTVCAVCSSSTAKEAGPPDSQ